MKRFYILPLIAATALVACNKTVETAQIEQPEQSGEVALNFGAYVYRGTTTKSGAPGLLTTNAGDVNLEDVGFGVFAYYSNGELYNEMAKPDFMYNQRVQKTGADWTYSPIRYWPNEFGTNAESEDVDRLTFFAYAPWVLVTPSTGIVAENSENDATTGDASFSSVSGIVGLSRNTATGDPLVKYVVNMLPEKSVDLCWGVAHSDWDNTAVVNGAAANTITPGEPYIDVVKPTVGTRVKFDFKHALASLNVQIDADIDEESHGSNPYGDTGAGNAEFTHVYVRSIIFEGFTTKGALNLNSSYSEGPTWVDLGGNGILSLDPVTVYDGRRDGKEGIESAVAKNETPYDLNPIIIQTGPYAATQGTQDEGFQYTALTVYNGDGITHSGVPSAADGPVNLFDVESFVSASIDKLNAPVYVIPTGEKLKVTVVYDVETADATLPGFLSDGQTRGTSVENAITKTIDAITMEAGKKYILKLHLGLTSVKFDAVVAEWEDGDLDINSDHPINTDGSSSSSASASSAFSATTAAAPQNDDVAATITEYTLEITGLTAGEVINVQTYTEYTPPSTYVDHFGNITDIQIIEGLNESMPAANGTVGASGTIKIKVTLDANTTAVPVTSEFIIRQGSEGPADHYMYYQITQAAA